MTQTYYSINGRFRDGLFLNLEYKAFHVNYLQALS